MSNKSQVKEPKILETPTPQFYHEIAKLPKLAGTTKNKNGDWIDNNFPLTRYPTHIKLGTTKAREVLEYNEDGLPVISLQSYRQKNLVKNLLKRIQAKGVDFKYWNKTTYLVAETRYPILGESMPMVSFWRKPPKLLFAERTVYLWDNENFQYWINTKSAFKLFLSRVIYKINLEDFKEVLDESN